MRVMELSMRLVISMPLPLCRPGMTNWGPMTLTRQDDSARTSVVDSPTPGATRILALPTMETQRQAGVSMASVSLVLMTLRRTRSSPCRRLMIRQSFVAWSIRASTCVPDMRRTASSLEMATTMSESLPVRSVEPYG